MDFPEKIEQQLQDENASFLALSDEEIDALTPEQLDALQQEHSGRLLVQLPPREQAFFAWLKSEDPEVWYDLWDEDEDLLVTLAYLPEMQAGGRGFPICDLEHNPNYYFTHKHLTRDGMVRIARILELAQQGKELAIGEALLFEIMVAPIDIWHFCYKYGVPLAKAKETAHELYRMNVLIHLTERADLIRYFDEE